MWVWMGVLGLRGSGVQRALCFSFWEGVRTDISASDAMDWIGIPVAASSAERLLREREKGTEGRPCCVGGYLSIFAFLLWWERRWCFGGETGRRALATAPQGRERLDGFALGREWAGWMAVERGYPTLIFCHYEARVTIVRQRPIFMIFLFWGFEVRAAYC